MNLDFWTARWSQQRIGFHRADVNPNLLSHGPRWLGFSSWDDPFPLRGRRILVPLCGKALDLRWLADQGANVTGVEFVEQAALAFFEEQQLPYVEHQWRSGKVFTSTDPGVAVRIAVADIFGVRASELGPMDAVYDRAALIAVEPGSRARYAEQVASLCPLGARLLLVTFEHDTGGGPPFSVARAELPSLFGETFAPTLVEDADLLLTEPQWRERGAKYCREQVWLGARV